MDRIVEDWFVVRAMDEGIVMIQEPGHVQSFLVLGQDRAALIDTGMGVADIRAAVEVVTDLPVQVLNTHWHFDHIGGNARFSRIGAASREASLVSTPLSNALLTRLYLAPCLADGVSFPEAFDPRSYEIKSPAPTLTLAGGDSIDLGNRQLAVMETPGHTRGSLSFLDSRTASLFSGDLVYNGTLYAHFTDSDVRAYEESLERLCDIQDRISGIYACHNEPFLPPEFLKSCLEAVTAAARGRTRSERVTDWGLPVLRHEFCSLAVLTPDRDSRGIDILSCKA